MVKPPLETPNTAVTAVEIPLVPEIINGQTASVRSKAPTVKHSRSIKWELSVTANMVYFTLSNFWKRPLASWPQRSQAQHILYLYNKPDTSAMRTLGLVPLGLC